MPARGPRHAAAGRPVRADLVLPVAVGLAVLLGLAVRLWMLGNYGVNSDESVVGLVALGIDHGHLDAFVWNQPYGGAQPYVVAGFFQVLGRSPLVLNLVPAVLAAGSALLTWRIAARWVPGAWAVVAGALAWIWPEATVFNSTRNYGYHQAALLAGLGVLLVALRIAGREGGRPATWGLAGLLAGVGWWASPEVVYFLVPAALLLLVALTRQGRGRALAGTAVRLGVALAGLGAGALPWILAGVDDHWAVLGAAGGNATSHTYAYRLETFFTHVLPMELGLRIEGLGRWEGGTVAGDVLFCAVLGVVVAAATVVALKVQDGWVLAVFCAAFPFLYAAFPTTWFWNDGRYGIFLTPVLSVLLVVAAREVLPAGSRRWVGAGALVLAAASMLVAFQSTSGALGSLQAATRWHANPDPMVSRAAGRLEQMGVTHAYAGYWVAYDLEFLSGGRVTATAVAVDRNRSQTLSVERAARAAWIFAEPSPSQRHTTAVELGTTVDLNPPGITLAGLTGWLAAHRVGYRTAVSGPFVVVVPDRNVTPTQVAGLPPG